MQALVDADVLKWRWAAAGEYDMYLAKETDPETNEVKEYFIRGKKAAKKLDPEAELLEHVIEPVENVLHSVKLAVEHIMKVTGCSAPRFFLGGEGNFREKLYSKYKCSRVGKPKPHHQQAVVEYLIRKWGAELVDGMEADDALAIHQSANTVICSQDKDLLQVPGKHYNFVTQEKRFVTPREGDFALYQQIITGDSTDDIPGLRGFGPKKADGILVGGESSRELLQRVVKLYKEQERSVEDLILTARLVYLKRTYEDDFVERREVSEWLHTLKREVIGDSV